MIQKNFKDFSFKKGKSKADEFYLFVMFAGGDADTEHPEYYTFGFPFSDYKNHLEEINTKIEKFKKLGKILDINNKDFCESYEEVEKKFGTDMADTFDTVPNDPQNDYQNKCYIESIKLVGYDKEGVKHTANA